MNDTLYVVVPCYNEQEVLRETAKRLKQKLTDLMDGGKIGTDSKIMFVDDGSKDDTWNIIENLNNEDALFSGVKLSRNRGHQNALLAGLTTAYEKNADVAISIDADLQDDIDAVDRMLEDYANGSQIVYGVRAKRKKDTFFKRFTAERFYKIMKRSGVDIVFNHADYRLMSRTALEALLRYRETNLFLRGILPQIGYPSSVVQYERSERFAGKSKYPLKKMISFAVDGITSFSCKPLYSVFGLGIAFSFLGFAAFAATLAFYILSMIDALYPIISFMLLLCGIVISCIGLVGLYVGKTYLETKNRPRFIIEKIID